ncbi:hypothetical protein CBM2609_B20079 [Cupriavidus taiwanensis]|nr:hypothetical protein CBM2604_B30078 [Cupriavidus taiwanensis]SOZ32219.1 hypothetical protein CBM2609_B20079 [Cupriavidus taiwanensis]SOZ47818.1 hypothetical protein CBM2610_B20078 [Cupriavidus taiwanensis]
MCELSVSGRVAAGFAPRQRYCVMGSSAENPAVFHTGPSAVLCVRIPAMPLIAPAFTDSPQPRFRPYPPAHPLYVADIRHGVYRRFTITVRAGRRLKDEGGTPLSGQGGSMR